MASQPVYRRVGCTLYTNLWHCKAEGIKGSAVKNQCSPCPRGEEALVLFLGLKSHGCLQCGPLQNVAVSPINYPKHD